MERTDYPTIPTTVPHHAALNALRDRLQRAHVLNTEIADWLAERRKVEELYVQGLQRLCKRPNPSDASELGIFQAPWQRIVNSTSSLATAHHVYSQKLETEVERPIREFPTHNKEWASLRTMEGNLNGLAKAIDTSEDKVEKLRKKGKRAEPAKVAEATAGFKEATGNWDSQSPFIFEQLQAVDESRITQLRESLTRMQTLELDQFDHMKELMEATVQALLDANTADEIKSFVNRVCGGKSASIGSRPASQRAPLALQAPSIVMDDSVSVQSSSSADKGHGLAGGLRRLGTVLKSRRTSSMFPYQNQSPLEHRVSNDRLGLGFNKAPSFSAHSPTSSAQNLAIPLGESSSGPREQPERLEIQTISLQTPNTNSPTSPTKDEAPTPTASTPATNQITKDAEGYSVPPPQKSLVDEIPDNEGHSELEQAPTFKVEIRNDVIPEEEADAADAMSKVATTLRAQQTVSKRNRGRRDVRNTIYTAVPDAPAPEPNGVTKSPQTTENNNSPSQVASETSPSISQSASSFSPSTTENGPPLTIITTTAAAPAAPAATNATASTTATATPATATATPATALSNPLASPFTPLKMVRQSTLASDAGSDTQSIISGLSATSQGGQAIIKHPSLHEPGLTASLIENVSASFEAGQSSKVAVIGEIALAYNPVEGSAPQTAESLRFDQYGMMEKISLNQSHISPGSKPGEYSVSLVNLRGTAVSFRYQLKMDEVSMQSYPPIIVTPTWKLEDHQASLILSYKPNPLFNQKNADSLFSSPTLRNLVFITGLEGAKATSCQSKPPATFFKDRSRIAWRIPEVKLGDEVGGKLIARLFTDGLAKPVPVDVRWEIFGSDDIKNAGSGVGIEILKAVEVEKDPFADETDENAVDARGEWKEVNTVRKLISGKYVAA
ncbi:hypothetical protein DRE_04699 [Drechslerella stenobrocha 248]|uniref:MHD domain-containing protein n=1 Tax=Drechslerella stenobrocha 248 TaxID=1043628 RepID=W7IAN2_9PEZI|nr:hypothetical protein DRE_04699 [Drechslerella stenobrocha 248]